MTSTPDLNQLDAQALRDMTVGLLKQVEEMRGQLSVKDQELIYRQTRIDQLTHEMAVLKRYQFGKRSEQLDSTQASLLDESVDADIAAIEEELAQLVAEKLDYVPGVFTVEQHVRGKWVCLFRGTAVNLHRAAPFPRAD